MEQTWPPDVSMYIRNIPFFSLLEAPFQHELLTSPERVYLAKNQYLFYQGDPGGEAMYVVIEGQLRVFVTGPDAAPLVVDEHGPGAIVGEIGLLTGGRRTATIQATTEAELIRIAKTTFDRFTEKHPEVIAQAQQLALRRLQRPQLFSVLPNLLGPLDLATFAEVEAELNWLHLARGQRLIRQGEIDDNLYVLISGRLQVVTTDRTGHEQVIGEIGPGESVGEMHLLTGEARSATVYSIRDSELVQLSKASFDWLVAKHPHIMEHIAQHLIRRLQQTIQPSAGNQSNLALDIAVVPLHPSVPLAEFSQRLVAALEKFGPTLALDEERFETELGRPGAARIAADDPTDLGLVIWLNQQATQYRFRLFQANISVTPWTRRCLRQADLVLLVGWAYDNPALSEVETALQEWDADWGGVRRYLILLHQAGHHPPIGTGKWLNVRRLQQHYHLRWHQTADFERLARFVTGRAVGLVLGGGGVRGLAHLGIIRAIEELGLKIDLVGGSSFGAIIADYYALEWDYETIYRSVKPRADRRALLDYTFPFLALSQGKKMNRQLKQIFGNSQIEDTWRPFFCTSSNLTTAEEVVHRQGSLWKYIRASSAVPPLFPPIIEGEMVLMDGGIMNNLPLDVMQRLANGGPVIGVGVSVDKMMPDDLKFMTEISGWKILWSYLNPFTPAIKVPPLPQLITRAATLGSTRRRALQHHLADLCIYPPVARFGEVEAEAIDDIIEVGYQTGRQALEAWLNQGDNKGK